MTLCQYCGAEVQERHDDDIQGPYVESACDCPDGHGYGVTAEAADKDRRDKAWASLEAALDAEDAAGFGAEAAQ